MTAGQLIDYIRSLTRTDTEPAHLLTLLDTAQREVAQILRAPTQTVTYTGITSPADLALPGDAQEEGLLEVYNLSVSSTGAVLSETKVGIFDFRTASQMEPNWPQTSAQTTARFVVYDPVAIDAYPHPIPPPSSTKPQSFRVVYVSRPDDLTSIDDEPFGGALKVYHTILAYRVAWLLTGEQRHLYEYNAILKRARAAVQQPPIMGVNRLYAAFSTKGRR